MEPDLTHQISWFGRTCETYILTVSRLDDIGTLGLDGIGTLGLDDIGTLGFGDFGILGLGDFAAQICHGLLWKAGASTLD